jgi:hypothetical protein
MYKVSSQEQYGLRLPVPVVGYYSDSVLNDVHHDVLCVYDFVISFALPGNLPP